MLADADIFSCSQWLFYNFQIFISKYRCKHGFSISSDKPHNDAEYHANKAKLQVKVFL